MLLENTEEPTLPQWLGALDLADVDPDLAQAGFDAASYIQLSPSEINPTITKAGGLLPDAEYINAVVEQMLNQHCSPQQIGAFVASVSEW